MTGEMVLEPRLERLVTAIAGLPAKECIAVIQRASYVRYVNNIAVPRTFNERMDFERAWDARVREARSASPIPDTATE